MITEVKAWVAWHPQRGIKRNLCYTERAAQKLIENLVDDKKLDGWHAKMERIKRDFGWEVKPVIITIGNTGHSSFSEWLENEWPTDETANNLNLSKQIHLQRSRAASKILEWASEFCHVQTCGKADCPIPESMQGAVLKANDLFQFLQSKIQG